MTCKIGDVDDKLPPPAPNGLSYRKFQLATILLARERKNLLVSLPMGTGKTVVAIGVINDQPEIKKILIICPANLRINWGRELLKWLVRRGMTIGFATTKRGFPMTDVVIINYDILKQFSRVLHATHWDLIIADEAHYLRNPATRRSLVVCGRKSDDPTKYRPKLEADRWLMLSGTPIVNRPIELWPLIHHLDPSTWYSRASFIRGYCGGSSHGQAKSDIGEENLQRLHSKLCSTVMVRRTKEELLPELPSKTRQVLVLPADKARGAVSRESKHFDAVQKQLSRARLRAELAKTSDNDDTYREVVQQLRKVEFLSVQEITAIRMQTALAKVPLVVEHVESLLEHVDKVVIFAHHAAVIGSISAEFGTAVVSLHGKTPRKDRQVAIDRFKSDPSCRVFIGSIRVAGEGISLTSSSVVCFAELDWTPSALEQCEDRVWRYEQTRPVLVQHLVLDGTLDARMAMRLVEKQETISTVLDDVSETQASLYALSRSVPFVEADRDAVLELGRSMSAMDVSNIHLALEAYTSRGRAPSVADLDFTLMLLLAREESIEPAQAALGLLLLNKYRVKP